MQGALSLPAIILKGNCMSIESRFGYGKGYTPGSQSSNFNMSDASNIASIHILSLIPKVNPPHDNCYCIDCAGFHHEREQLFDTIKTEIENAMEIAYIEGKVTCG